MTDDRHSPTTAGPTPEPAPAVTVVASTPTPPPGSEPEKTELPFGIPPDRPEILVGAAFAGGLVAAFILRHLGRD
jgi:hypothetical protein